MSNRPLKQQRNSASTRSARVCSGFLSTPGGCHPPDPLNSPWGYRAPGARQVAPPAHERRRSGGS
eukprot:63564-Alexandrium_andersonii.AAC.1